jgi:molecular chaperone DnaK
MDEIVGIDFGTTKTIAAVIRDGSAVVVPDRRGRNSIPSVVLVTPETEESIFVGWEAKEHPHRYQFDHVSISSIKRSLGTGEKGHWGWLQQYPEAIAGLILARLKLELEHQLKHKVEKAVIAIPANYSINQRWAIAQAAELAGLRVMRLINEATAAALYYNFSHEHDRTLLIFDLGGGTLDVSVVEVGEGICEVRATAGHPSLGGDDFDQLLMDFVLTKTGAGSVKSLELFRQLVLKEIITKAKIELSSAPDTRIYLPSFIKEGSESPRDLDITIRQEEFIEISQTLLKEAEQIIEQVMQTSTRSTKLDAALIIGGGSRMPAIRALVKRVTGLEPFVGLDSELCVAQGAAVQAGVISGKVTDACLLDVTPLSLSIETLGGVASKLIWRHTTIPTRKKETFTTAADRQTQIKVNVFEGERPMAADNRFLGNVVLNGIPPAPAGQAQIEVGFDIEINGLLIVSAKDLGTGREVKSTLESPSRLAPEELVNARSFMERMTSKMSIHLSWEEEKHLLEESRRKVASWKQSLEETIKIYEANLTDDQLSLLRSGLQVLMDYSERGVAHQELERIYDGLKQQTDLFTKPPSEPVPLESSET